jgi:hypothetical protein
MRKDDHGIGKNERKRKRSMEIDLSSVKPCSLDELPAPSKIKKKCTMMSSSKQLSSKQVKRDQGSIITEHIATLKRKQLSYTPVVNTPTSYETNQLVPLSPSLEEISNTDNPHQDHKGFYSHTKSPLSPSLLLMATAKRHQPLHEASIFTDDKDPMSSNITGSNVFHDNFVALSSDPGGSPDLINQLPFPLPSLSPPKEERLPPFDPSTFGIQRIYPREE